MEGIKSTLIDNQSQDNDQYRHWNNSETKLLIHLYKEYKPKVGLQGMRTIRHLWEFIGNEMRTRYNTNVTAKHVENKWRVLERSYKKVITNNNKTGRSRKIFEYENEFNDIFKNKQNCFPAVLLSSVEEIHAQSTISSQNALPSIEIELETRPVSTVQANITTENVIENVDIPTTSSATTSNTAEVKKKSRVRKRINNTEELKEEFKSYYNKKLEIEKRKLEKREKYYNDALEEKKKIRLAMERRNELYEKMIERNMNLTL